MTFSAQLDLTQNFLFPVLFTFTHSFLAQLKQPLKHVIWLSIRNNCTHCIWARSLLSFILLLLNRCHVPSLHIFSIGATVGCCKKNEIIFPLFIFKSSHHTTCKRIVATIFERDETRRLSNERRCFSLQSHFLPADFWEMNPLSFRMKSGALTEIQSILKMQVAEAEISTLRHPCRPLRRLLRGRSAPYLPVRLLHYFPLKNGLY